MAGAEAAGEDAEAATREALEEEVKAGIKRTARDIADESKRAGRRRRTEILDLGLELCAAWLRDLAALASGAEEVVFNRDRLDLLRTQAQGLDPARARRGAELVQETRRGARPQRLRGAGPRERSFIKLGAALLLGALGTGPAPRRDLVCR